MKNEKPMRVLQVLTVMDKGGAEVMVMNYYRALDRTKYQFDFLVHRQVRGRFDDEIESMGGRIFRAMPIRPGNYLRYFLFLNDFFSRHAQEFIAVHAHIGENSYFCLRCAHKYGIANTMLTSHTANTKFDFKRPFRWFARQFDGNYVKHRLACGEEAGVFLFGRKPFVVLKNAIPTERYTFNLKIRNEFRAMKNWGRTSVIIGHVGRIGHPKNHRFLVEVFKEFHRLVPDSILVLVGDGEDRNKIEDLVLSYNLQDYVKFEGVQDNVSDYLQAFDVFVFPSLFEGLPVSVIEAQAAGLHCFLSDTIDKETDITGDVSFLSLQLSAKQWAESIISTLPYDRSNNESKIIGAGYDVKTNLNQLLALYLN
ncbi:MAG: glycosyltransferase family 1 protein [Sodaliphilus pleomorphus]|uniref:glycosyltransferase family 1 protein n=1 Tax=Sodaliphilus pleomorphus TaxID=2606626 RepID=UPI00240A6A42|nr:glycosyltransferase family 1 protein [Sodaliphilus pleomorphus]MDD6474750.1 glycosyltransferase family 1 protein [Sodaliphilus pleomorphus]